MEPGRRAIDVSSGLALILVGVVLPLIGAVAAGSLGVPHNDDWAYRRVLEGWSATGQLRLTGWESMTLVGQLAWARMYSILLGPHTWVPGVSTAILGAVGLLASYALARRLLTPGRAFLATLTLVAAPGFALYATNFMTDVPGTAAQALCLLLGAVALDRHGRYRAFWLLGSLVVGLFAFSIREFGIAAPAAVLVVAALLDRPRWPRYAMAGMVFAVAGGVLYSVSQGLPGRSPVGQLHPSFHWWAQVASFYFTLSLSFSPAIALSLVHVRCWWNRRWALVGAASGVLIAALSLRTSLLRGSDVYWLAGNVLTQVGAPGYDSAGGRPELFPIAIWVGLNALAAVSGVLLLALLAGIMGRFLVEIRRVGKAVFQRLGPAESLLGAYLVIEVTGLVVYTMLGFHFFDRYVWPLAVPAAVLLLAACRVEGGRAHPGRPAVASWISRALVAGGLASLVGLLAVSAALTLNAEAWDAARWSAASSASQELGIPARSVDGGFEWVGYHSSQGPDRGRVGSARASWWVNMFSDSDSCAVISGGPLDRSGLTLIRVTAYGELLVIGHESLYTYADPSCGRS